MAAAVPIVQYLLIQPEFRSTRCINYCQAAGFDYNLPRVDKTLTAVKEFYKMRDVISLIDLGIVTIGLGLAFYMVGRF